MKKMMIMILACLMLLSLCACGARQETPNTTEGTTATTTAATTAPTTTDATMQQIQPTKNLKAMAERCIGRPVADLYMMIGEPASSDYAPSCMGDGEDGNLYYDGFIVYTYREGDEESVYYVE